MIKMKSGSIKCNMNFKRGHENNCARAKILTDMTKKELKCKSLSFKLDDVSFVSKHPTRFDEGLQPNHPLRADLDLLTGNWILKSRQPKNKENNATHCVTLA